MKKSEMVPRKDECLHDYVERLCSAVGMSAEQVEVVHQVQKWCYIKGSDDTQRALLKNR